MGTETPGTATGALSGLLENPVVGMSPWIVFSLLAGPGRFEWAVGISLAAAVALVVLGRVANRGSSWKLLELADVVFFGTLTVIGALASEGTRTWLETYAGEVATFTLAAIAFGSMAVGMPFTLQYAREQADPSIWHTREFIRTNYMITGVWGLAFLVSGLAGLFGDLVLRSPDNMWTQWIIPILAIVAALRFTAWYPDVVRARAAREAKGLSREPPNVASLLLPVAGLLVPIGIAVLVFDGDLWWLGAALIVMGGVLTKTLHARSEAPATPSR
ncbi:hypothetical protein [Streptomyces sp. NPDC101206]|uniref:hypothetical protein n=1 Tax=Streptomyces sp. NPDC101206 TaxID=3366128 RepID=UPI0037F24CD2